MAVLGVACNMCTFCCVSTTGSCTVNQMATHSMALKCQLCVQVSVERMQHEAKVVSCYITVLYTPAAFDSIRTWNAVWLTHHTFY